MLPLIVLPFVDSLCGCQWSLFYCHQLTSDCLPAWSCETLFCCHLLTPIHGCPRAWFCCLQLWVLTVHQHGRVNPYCVTTCWLPSMTVLELGSVVTSWLLTVHQYGHVNPYCVATCRLPSMTVLELGSFVTSWLLTIHQYGHVNPYCVATCWLPSMTVLELGSVVASWLLASLFDFFCHWWSHIFFARSWHLFFIVLTSISSTISWLLAYR